VRASAGLRLAAWERVAVAAGRVGLLLAARTGAWARSTPRTLWGSGGDRAGGALVGYAHGGDDYDEEATGSAVVGPGGTTATVGRGLLVAVTVRWLEERDGAHDVARSGVEAVAASSPRGVHSMRGPIIRRNQLEAYGTCVHR
jgi:hypothetical protein